MGTEHESSGERDTMGEDKGQRVRIGAQLLLEETDNNKIKIE